MEDVEDFKGTLIGTPTLNEEVCVNEVTWLRVRLGTGQAVSDPDAPSLYTVQLNEGF